MQIIERFLLSITGISLAGIVAIFAISDPPSVEKKKLSTAPTQAAAPKEEMVVLSDEVDRLIERYFENIRSNPAKAEEHERMVSLPSKETKIEERSFLKREKFSLQNHRVEAGESLWRIAQRYGVPVYTIVSANPTKKNSPIFPGEELRIPTRPGLVYQVKKGDSLESLAKRFKITLSDIFDLEGNPIRNLSGKKEIFLYKAKPLPETVYISKKRFILPIAGGRFTSRFGWRHHPIYGGKTFHSGIDIAAPEGTPIRAAASGIVVFAGEAGSYGFVVILRHQDDYFTVYGHCSSLLVQEGDYVKQGQLIARVGSTGTATGPHLHFEVKRKSRPINPIVALKETIRISKENG
ncbi:MAG: M23 family metallopeptidase [Leptospiraceae bacterium]|nr:M23 family metallopeptidase [Leptospiraceae bacterium]MDW8306421.1 M23 family metallopeptidase [Leptospiraceae bacterium]